MHMLKLLFQELQTWLTSPRRDSQPPGAQLKTTAWGKAGDVPEIGFQGKTGTTHQPGDS